MHLSLLPLLLIRRVHLHLVVVVVEVVVVVVVSCASSTSPVLPPPALSALQALRALSCLHPSFGRRAGGAGGSIGCSGTDDDACPTDDWCPMNWFRVGGDQDAAPDSWFDDLQNVVQFNSGAKS